MDIQKEITAYLKYCEFQKKLNKKTIKAYSIDLKQFLSTLNAQEGITKSTLSNYLVGLHQSFQPRTAKRKLASVRAFLNYLEYEEIKDDNPIRKIKTKFQEPKVLPKTIPIKLIEKILTIARQEHDSAKTMFGKFASLRDIAILETLFATGLRVSELCSLRMEDVDLTEGKIHVMGKGSKERIIHIGNKEVLKALKQYKTASLLRNRKTDSFFINRLDSRYSEQSVRFMIYKLIADAEISLHITPHMFRHSFASLLLEEDVNIRYIQQMLGHSSIQTTQIYTQVSMSMQRNILTTKHPRNKFKLN